MKNTILFLALFTLVSLKAQNINTFFDEADAFFKANVTNGRVSYKEIKENPESLRSLLSMAKDISIPISEANTYQSFWINMYNLLVIDGIVENYPLKSPLDVPGFFDKEKHEVGGENSTLNDIENKLLRGNFPSESRFHFVLVCAGLGCPPIIDEAYRPSNLTMQLQKQTLKALNDPNFIQVNNNKVKVSQIFEWYKEDFTQQGRSLVDYMNQYRTQKIPEKVKVSYYAYDWTLNDIK